MSLPALQSPPRTNDPAELWRWWFEVRRRLAETGAIAWASIDKTGSSIADLAIRSHALLTNIGTLTHDQIEAELADLDARIIAITGAYLKLDGTSTMTGDFQLDNHDLYTTGRLNSGSLVTSWINNFGDTKMGDATNNAGEFQMIRGLVAGDPTFTIVQSGNNVTINQTVGGIIITCDSGEIDLDNENLKTTGTIYATGPSAQIQVEDGGTLKAYSAGNDKWVSIYHDDTTGYLQSTDGVLHVPNTDIELGDGAALRAYSNGDDKHVEISHNDTTGLITSTDGTISFDNENLTTTGNITGATLTNTGGRVGKVTTVTTTYTVLVTDHTVICNSATAFTVTLPTAVVGQIFRIKNIGAGTVTVQGAGGTDTIDGLTSQSLVTWDCMEVQCYAANKWGIM